MAITKSARESIMTRAHADKEFRTELLKELLRLAVAADPELLEKAVARVEKRSKK